MQRADVTQRGMYQRDRNFKRPFSLRGGRDRNRALRKGNSFLSLSQYGRNLPADFGVR
jgi:hypothetical protein